MNPLPDTCSLPGKCTYWQNTIVPAWVIGAGLIIRRLHLSAPGNWILKMFTAKETQPVLQVSA